MPARGGGKAWQQKTSFYVSSRCFSGQKMTKGKLQKVTIKCTFGPQNRSRTLDKWTRMLSWCIGRHTCKAKENKTIWKWVVGDSSKNPYKKLLVNSNQMYLGLARRPGTCLPFISVDNNRERKKEKQQKEKKNKTHVSLHSSSGQVPGTYSLVCHGEFFVQTDQQAHY